MKWLALAILLIMPLASAIDLGGFQQCDGKITGKYLPAGLEGKISCYEKGEHIMDLIYNNDSIEISIQFFDILNKVVERNQFLKEELEKALMEEALAPINLSGASFELGYEGCIIELHDIPTRFLRVKCDEIIISGFDYEINKTSENMLKLQKTNFSATLFSYSPVEVNESCIIAKNEIMIVSFSYAEEKKIEDAFEEKSIGGEITIADYDENKVDYISYFGNVSVSLSEIKTGKIVLDVSGDEKSGGKIIKVNLGKNVCLTDKLKIKFDRELIKRADNLEDILNPDDDGITPEYYIVQSKDGMFLLVTIPHFSTHQLIIQFVSGGIIEKTVAILLGFLTIAVATIYLFKK